MEAAEENLSQILPERALTPEEVRELLPPVLDALTYLHTKGMVHGHLRSSNIQAAGDQVKLSSETARASGDQVPSVWKQDSYAPPESVDGTFTPASDMWSFGMTLVEVLTQQRPAWNPTQPATPKFSSKLPAPFADIAQRCLQVDPEQRWTAAEIATGRQSRRQATAPLSMPTTTFIQDGKKPARRSPLLVIILLLVVIASGALVLSKRRSSSVPRDNAHEAHVESPPAATVASPTGAAARGTVPSGRFERNQNNANAGEVLQQLMPQVSTSARRSIQGTIKVIVRVKVDESGSVSETRLISAGPSKYFSRLASDAAREWKFTPAKLQDHTVSSEWNVQFAFRRSGTNAVSRRISPP
jgi:TonB family protein